MGWEMKKRGGGECGVNLRSEWQRREERFQRWYHAWSVYTNAIPISLTRSKQTNREVCSSTDFTAAWVMCLFLILLLLSVLCPCTLFACYIVVSIIHADTLFAHYLADSIPLLWIFIQAHMNYKDLPSLSIFNQTWWKSVSWWDMGKITVNTSPVVPVNKCDSEGEFFMTMKSLPTARWKLFSTPAEPLVFCLQWTHSKFRNVKCSSKNTHLDQLVEKKYIWLTEVLINDNKLLIRLSSCTASV